ncbi:MAG: xanthine dehydrogenase family protein molybdopterin-binding subunit [Acidimicrobiia bacterium]|nr:xanthine dehydrogenase family protein molybdopterin-binding subunit [Acidimicrobiia bacterium]
MSTSGSILGNSVLRKEDPGLLTGANQYVDDIQVPNTAHIVFVRSTAAHAKLGNVDVSEARSMPGVVAVYVDGDLPIPDNVGFEGAPEHKRPPLARGKVRFVGDIIAAVVAETRTQAVDAAEAVMVELDPLPAVVDLEAAAADGATLLYEDLGTNVAFATELGADSDALAGADTVVKERILSQRLAGVPMEANCCLAVPDGAKMLFYVASQGAHAIQGGLLGDLGMDAADVRVVIPWVGGGFGPKFAYYVEYGLTAVAAKTLGRPVRWTETRSENMLSMVQGRDFIMDTEMGINRDGKIVGLRARVLADGGAYPMVGTVLPMLTQLLSQAVYDVPKIDFAAKTLVTNKTPVGAYRGAGRPEATQMVERIIDVAAKAIGMDPAEVRRKNFLQPEQFPLTTITGAAYDSGEYEKALDAVLAASSYADLRAEQAQRRARGDAKLLGIGLSSYVEITAPLGLFEEWGAVEINDDGSATIKVGTSSHGQGHDTAFSMIVSDKLGIPMDQIHFVQSDTDVIPHGAGTAGSRSLQTAGSAVFVASDEVWAKATTLAAKLLEANEADIVKGDNGGVQVAGVPARSLSWAQLATAAKDAANGVEGGLRHELDFSEGESTFPFGSHVSVVEIDTDTGHVQLLRHVAVDDCGRILNPVLVTGQQHGGIAQGIAQALYEWVQYDEDGNPRTGNLADYLMPSAAELVSFETSNTETPSPRNPLGAKGIGESGTIGSTPAVHNAVCDAVSHLGITHIDMPCTPERVWRALQTAS